MQGHCGVFIDSRIQVEGQLQREGGGGSKIRSEQSRHAVLECAQCVGWLPCIFAVKEKELIGGCVRGQICVADNDQDAVDVACFGFFEKIFYSGDD